MGITAILGAQWGDEGKGKIAVAISRGAKVCARFQGGPNAGHTVYYGGEKLLFRMIPSGILNSELGVIGNGAMVNPRMLLDEYRTLRRHLPDLRERLRISRAAHVILSSHVEEDCRRYSGMFGTTRMGIGPAYIGKAARTGMRMGDILDGGRVRGLAKEDRAACAEK
jgi:adenylosuccinate synthase